MNYPAASSGVSNAQTKKPLVASHGELNPTRLNMWTTPPFAPLVKDGWLYGRGSGDMKAGIAANIYAIEASKRCGYAPAAELQ